MRKSDNGKYFFVDHSMSMIIIIPIPMYLY